MADSDSIKPTEDPNFQGGVMSPKSKQHFSEMRFNAPTISKQKIVLDEDTFALAFLKCTMCKELYNQKDRAPRILPCHHTFCFDCILKFFRAETEYRASLLPSGTASSSVHDVAVPIMCPTCRNTFLTSRDGLNELVTDHRIVQLIDFVGTTERHETAYCPKHNLQCLNFFCEKCKQTVCKDCTIIDHKVCVADKMVLDLNTAKEKYAPAVEKGVQSMEDELKSLKEKKGDCEKALSGCKEGDQELLIEIKESFAKLRKALDDREQELLTSAKSQTGGGREDVEEKIKRISDKQSEVEQLLQTLKTLNTDDNLIKLYTNFEKIQAYETEPPLDKQTEQTETQKLKFVCRDEPAVINRLAKYGELQETKPLNGSSTYSSGYGSSSYSSYLGNGNSYSSSRYTGSSYTSGTGSSYSSRYVPRSSYR